MDAWLAAWLPFFVEVNHFMTPFPSTLISLIAKEEEINEKGAKVPKMINENEVQKVQN